MSTNRRSTDKAIKKLTQTDPPLADGLIQLKVLNMYVEIVNGEPKLRIVYDDKS